jgi:hypothetical protein
MLTTLEDQQRVHVPLDDSIQEVNSHPFKSVSSSGKTAMEASREVATACLLLYQIGNMICNLWEISRCPSEVESDHFQYLY